MKKYIILIILVIVLFNILKWIIGTRNRLIRKVEEVKSSMSNLGVMKEQRENYFNDVFQAAVRVNKNEVSSIIKVMKESSVTGMTDSQAEDNVQNLRALGQQFPELNSDSSYLVAVKKLSDAVQDISSARRIINENIKDYNTDIAQFPTCIISSLFGYKRKELIDEKRALQEGNKLDRHGVDFKNFDI